MTGLVSGDDRQIPARILGSTHTAKRLLTINDSSLSEREATSECGDEGVSENGKASQHPWPEYERHDPPLRCLINQLCVMLLLSIRKAAKPNLQG